MGLLECRRGRSGTLASVGCALGFVHSGSFGVDGLIVVRPGIRMGTLGSLGYSLAVLGIVRCR